MFHNVSEGLDSFIVTTVLTAICLFIWHLVKKFICSYVLTRVALRLWSILTPDSRRRLRSGGEISGTLAYGSVWCGEPAIRDFRTSSARIGLDLFIFRCIPSLGFLIFKDKYLFYKYLFFQYFLKFRSAVPNTWIRSKESASTDISQPYSVGSIAGEVELLTQLQELLRRSLWVGIPMLMDVLPLITFTGLVPDNTIVN